MASNAIGPAGNQLPGGAQVNDPQAAATGAAANAAKSGGFGGLMGKIGLGGKKDGDAAAAGGFSGLGNQLADAGKNAAIAEAQN